MRLPNSTDRLLTRDVNYLDYGANPLTQAAAADLSRFSDFRGPKAASLLRPYSEGTLPAPSPAFTSLSFCGKMFPSAPKPSASRSAPSYLTMITWFRTGSRSARHERGSDRFDPAPRYIRNNRDLAEWVHIDVLFQAYCFPLRYGEATKANRFAKCVGRTLRCEKDHP